MSLICMLIADDQAFVRGALTAFLGLESDLKAVAQVGWDDEVLDAVHKHAMGVTLVDVDMPGRDGLAATAEVVGSDSPHRCLIVTTFGRPGYLSRGMETGAAGFIAKGAPPEALAEAICKVHAGLRVIDPELAQESVLLGPNLLTEREKEVLLAATTGVDAREIATRLSLGEGMARNYLSSAVAKIHTHNRIEVVCIVETDGWL